MRCEIRSFIGTRARQEDAAEKCETDRGLFVAVCDGIGSRPEGGAPSSLAAGRFAELFKTEYTENYPAFIVDAANRIDDEVTGSTATAAGQLRLRHIYAVMSSTGSLSATAGSISCGRASSSRSPPTTTMPMSSLCG